MSAIERYRHAGKRHAGLAILAGEWNISMRVWEKSGELSVQSDHISETKSMVHEGR